MKRITVICNPASTPVKFPADIRYFYVSDTARMGEKTIHQAIQKHAKANSIAVSRIEIDWVSEVAVGQEGPDLGEGK